MDSPGAGADAPALVVRPAGETGKPALGLSFGDVASSNAMVQAAKLPDGSYSIKGSYGLEGTLKTAGPNLWKLDAKFSFPTGGYRVGEPYVTAFGESLDNPETDLLGYTGLIMINIPLQLPPKDAMLTQAVQEVPISLDIHAGPDANFTVVLASL